MWILPTAAAGMVCLMLYVSLPKINNNFEDNIEIYANEYSDNILIDAKLKVEEFPISYSTLQSTV